MEHLRMLGTGLVIMTGILFGAFLVMAMCWAVISGVTYLSTVFGISPETGNMIFIAVCAFFVVSYLVGATFRDGFK